MSAVDYEREYDNRGRVPEHPPIVEGWYRDAAQARSELPCRLDLAYGASERQKFDLFEPAERRGAAVLFLHGGYWQSQDKSGFSHLARGPLAHGLAVAVAGYDLCPGVSVAQIVAQAQAAVRHLAEWSGGRVVVAGHSAGGHLAAGCAAAADLPVQAALCLSGLFDLRPLLPTTINAKLGLDEAAAMAASPLLRRAPPCPVDLVVGEWESAEYHRQSLTLAAAWPAVARYEVLAGAHHFSVIAPLVDPASPLSRRLAALAATS